jgi:hypothetical protein
MRQAGRSTEKLLVIEYFMRQDPPLFEGLSTLIEEFEAQRQSRRSSP